LKVLFNGEEVAEVYFEYVNRDLDVEVPFENREEYEREHGCHLQFHSDLIRKTATQDIRSIRLRTPIW
jgi:hypothetical protein